MNRLVSCFILVFSLSATGVLAKSVTPIVVAGSPVEKTVINEIPLTGTVTSPQSADISTELSGLVKLIHVDEGHHVQAGGVILELDDELQLLSLAAAKAKTRQAQLELSDARRRLDDARRLVKQKTISKNDEQSLQAEVNIDSATVQLAQAEQARQQARLQRHKLQAPFDGVVSNKFTEAGEWITPGDAVVKLVATTGLRIDFQVPQSAYPKITLDTPLRIRLETHPGKAFTGKIAAIVPVTDARARTFMIRVISTDKDILMMPGMSVNGALQLDTGRRSLTVSRDAILRYPDGRTTVWVINDDETVSEKLVKTGISFNGNTVIHEGLKIDDVIIVRGNESLRDGQKVSIQAE